MPLQLVPVDEPAAQPLRLVPLEAEAAPPVSALERPQRPQLVPTAPALPPGGAPPASALERTQQRMDSALEEPDQDLPQVVVSAQRLAKPEAQGKEPTWGELAGQIPGAIGATGASRIGGAKEYLGTEQYRGARKRLWQATILPNAVRESKEMGIALLDHPDVIDQAKRLGMRPDQFARDWPKYANLTPEQLSAVQSKEQATIQSAGTRKEAGKALREEAAGISQAYQPNVKPWSMKGLTFDLASSAPDLLIGAAGGAVGGPLVGVGAMMAEVSPGFYADGRNQGLSHDKAGGYAALMTMAEGIPELPVLEVLSKTPAGKKALQSVVGKFAEHKLGHIAGTAAIEAASESITEALQIGIQDGVLDQHTSLPDALKQIARAGVIGLGMGAGVAGVTTGVESLATRSPKAKGKGKPIPGITEPTLGEMPEIKTKEPFMGEGAPAASPASGPSAKPAAAADEALPPQSVNRSEPVKPEKVVPRSPPQADSGTPPAVKKPAPIPESTPLSDSGTHPDLTALQAVEARKATPAQIEQLEAKKLVITNDEGHPRLLPAGRRQLRTLEEEDAAPPLVKRIKSDNDLRASLKAMRDETGWAETGGRIIRNPDTDQVTGRTSWIPRAEWWPDRPKGLTEPQVHAAVDKSMAGKKLTPREHAMVQFMADVHDERQKLNERIPEHEDLPEDYAPSSKDFMDDAHEAALVSRAAALDEDAVERLALQHENDQAGFLTSVKAYLDGHDHETAATDRQADQSAAGLEEKDQAPARQAAVDLFGEDTRSRQAMADEIRRRDQARSPNKDVPLETGRANDLFSKARQQVDIEDAPTPIADKAEAFAEELAAARADTHTEPTAAQKKSGRYPKGKVAFAGMPVRIENPAGSTRTKHDDEGKVEWSRKMHADYGYIERTEGNDGDQVDVFLTGAPDTGKVFVVNQVHADGKFDEHKAILGAETSQEAEKLYRSHYPKNWKGLKSVVEMPTEEFKGWLKTDGTKREVDRRANTAQRKKVTEMTPEQMREALLSHELTGIPNRRAYEDAPRLPVQVSVDVDSLKWVNDNMGHEQGNELLKAVSQALVEHTDQSFHISGDEFVVQAEDEAAAQEIMAKVATRLKDAEIKVEMPDGRLVTVKGLGVSYGLGDTLEDADAKLQTHKAERETQGLRAGRGSTPPGAAVRAARARGEDQAGGASEEEVAGRDTPRATKRKQTDTPEFKRWFGKSKVVDDEGAPLIVYRGEHGETEEGIHSRGGAISFGTKGAANTYAQRPNNPTGAALFPRVTPAYLSLQNPVVNEPDDPFIDFATIEKAVGRERALLIAKENTDSIQETNNWEEGFASEFDTVEDVIERAPDRLRDLYLDAYRVFDKDSYVTWFKEAGYDGAIHGGSGETALEPEYKVFDRSQIKSAIGNRGTFSSESSDIRFSKRKGELASQDVTSYNTTEVNDDAATYSGPAVSSDRGVSGSGPAGGGTLSLDLFAPENNPNAAQKAARALGNTRLVEIGTFRTGIDRVRSWEDAAHIFAPLRKEAQEHLMALVLNQAGEPLAMLRHTIGGAVSAPVEAWSLVGAIAQVPGAYQVYFAHNHPSGGVKQSEADKSVTQSFSQLMDGSGIHTNGMIVVGPNSRTASWYQYSEVQGDVPARARSKTIPVLSRRLIRFQKGPQLVGAESAKAYVKASPHQSGVILVSASNAVLGVVPMTRAEMETLRTRTPNKGTMQLLSEFASLNAPGAIVFGPNDPAIKNVSRMLLLANVSLVDELSRREGGEIVSYRDSGGLTKKSKSGLVSHFFARRKVASKGLSRERVQEVVARVLKEHSFAKLPQIFVVDTVSELPPDLKTRLAIKDDDQLTGAVFWPRRFGDAIFMVASNTGSEREAAENFYHELIGHYGLRQIMDAERYKAVMDGIWRDMPDRVREAATRNGLDVDQIDQRRTAAEEVIAYAAGELRAGGKPTTRAAHWLRQVLDQVRAYLKRLMGSEVFDDQAIAGIIQEAKRALEDPQNGVRHQMRTKAVRAQRAALFHSAAEKAVLAVKQDRASAEQWLAMVSKAPGVKADELDWLGLGDWLKGQKGAIDRQQVLDYIRANTLEVEDALHGSASLNTITRRVTELAEKLRAARYTVEFDTGKLESVAYEDENGKEQRLFADDPDILDKLPPVHREAVEELISLTHAPEGALQMAPDAAQYEQFTLPGGENYRELLMTLPNEFTPWQADRRKEVFDRFAPEMNELYKIAQGYALDSASRSKALDKWEVLLEERNRQANEIAPERAPYKNSHFGETNIVAHVRFKERTDADGKRVLFIEEIQSDWHQAGRKASYQGDETAQRHLAQTAVLNELRPKAEAAVKTEDLLGFDTLNEAMGALMTHPDWKERWDISPENRPAIEAYLAQLPEYKELTRRVKNAVPDAPFKTSWPELAMKRMIRWAAENNFERIAWTTGQQQAERFSLEWHVESIAYYPIADAATPSYDIRVLGPGSRVIFDGYMEQAKIGDYLGEEMATKIKSGVGEETEGDYRIISGLDLRSGGAGMKGFYDDILPRTVGKMIKKWGGKVGAAKVSVGETQAGEWAVVDATDEGEEEALSYHPTEERAIQALENHPDGGVKVQRIVSGIVAAHSFDITEPMRAAALNEGFPLFSRRQQVVDRDNAYSRQAAKVISVWNDKVGWRFGALGKLPMRMQYLERRYLALGEVQRAKEIGRSVYDALSRATPADQKEVYGFLTTKDADPAEIQNPAVRADAVNAKHQIDQAGRALVDAGLMSLETYEAHAGEYLPRLYLKHLLGKEGNRMLGTGKTLSDMGYLKKRKDIDEETRKIILGEITDPGFLASFGLTRTLRDIALVDFLEDVSHNKSWVPPEATVEWRGRRVSPFFLRGEARSLRDRMVHYAEPEKIEAAAMADKMDAIASKALEGLELVDLDDHRQVPDSGRYGALRGLWVRKEVYDDLIGSQQMVPADPSMMEKLLGEGGILTKVTGWWKMSKVALNPPSQIRNFVSNGVLLHLSGVPMRRVYSGEIYTRAITSMINKDKYYEIAKKYGLFAVTFANNELVRIRTEWLALQAKNSGAFSFARLKNMGAKAMNGASDLYALNESVSKIAKVIDAMEREGKGEAQAMTEAHEWLFDYSLVPRSVRFLRNAPLGIPFLTFQIKVLPKLAEVAVKYPWRYLPYVALNYGIAALFKSLWDVDDDDLKHLRRAMPTWLQEQGQTPILPWKDSLGRWQATNLGYILPWGMYADIAAKANAGKFSDIPSTVGMFSGPVPDLVSGVRTNTDSFTGQEIMRHDDPPAEQGQQLMSYLWSMAAPPWLTEKGWLGKLYKSVTGKVDPRTGEPLLTTKQANLGLAGASLYPFDPEESRQKNLRFMQFEISEIQKRMKSVLRDKNLRADPDREEFKARRKIYQELLNKKIKEMRQYKRDSEVPAKLRTSKPEGNLEEDDDESPTANNLQQLHSILSGKPRRQAVTELRGMGYPATAELVASLPPIADKLAQEFFVSQATMEG